MKAAALAAVLLLWANRRAWLHLLTHPRSLDFSSLGIIARHGVWPVALVAAYAFAARLVGRRLIDFLMIESERKSLDPYLMFCLSLSLGVGLTASSLFFFGMGGLLQAGALSALVGLWIFFSLPWRSGPLTWPRAPVALFETILAAALLYAAWNTLITALAPPTDWDSLAYHLAIPKIYWTHGRILEIPWLVHSHWPHLIEGLFVIPVAAGIDNAPALLHGLLSVTLVASVFFWSRTLWGSRAAWVSAALLAAQPVMTAFSGTAHDDGALALFNFQAALALWTWRSTRQAPWLLIAALLSGFAAASRLLGITPFLTLALLAVLGDAPSRKTLNLKAGAVFLAVGGAVAAPWYLKTWLASGNPLWPFYAEVLGGRFGAEWVERYLRFYDLQHFWTWRAAPDLLLHNGPHYLLLPLIFLTIASWRSGAKFPSPLKFLLVLAVPYGFMVFGHNEAWRFCLTLMPFFAMAAGWAAAELAERGGWKRHGAAAAVLFGLSPITRINQNNELFPVLGVKSSVEPERSTRTLYLERSLDHYRLYERINATVARTARILLFREIRGFYLERAYVWGDPLVQGLLRYDQIADAAGLRRRLSEMGITHVLVNGKVGLYQPSPHYYTPRTVELMARTLASYARPALSDGPLVLHELTP